MNSQPKSVSEIRVQDPLSDVTRKERRNLLIASFVGIIIVTTGLVPTKINSFGIEFTTSQRQWFTIIISLLIFYFLVSFIVYAASDFVAWRISFHATKLEHLNNSDKNKMAGKSQDEMLKVYHKLWNWTRVSLPVSLLRIFVEFVFPIIFGFYTAIKILNVN